MGKKARILILIAIKEKKIEFEEYDQIKIRSSLVSIYDPL